MAHEYLRELVLSGGFVTGGVFHLIEEDDLPRPAPNPAGTWHVVTVDQLGRVVGGTAGGLAGLAEGGTGADLSATGPGIVVQDPNGATLGPSTTISFDVVFNGNATFGGNLAAASLSDSSFVTSVQLDPSLLTLVVPSAGAFQVNVAGNTALAAGDGGAAATLGFYGVTPVARQSGDVGTGLVALGLFSSAAALVSNAVPQAASLAERFTADPAYCFTDAGGTTPCAATDPIRVWKDALVLAANYTQATSGSRPTLQLAGGRYFARFDATDDGMGGGASFNAPYTFLICGVKGTDAASGRRTLSASAVNNLLSLTNRSDVGRWYVAGSVGPTAPTLTGGRLHTVALTVAASGYAEAYLDGQLITSAVVSANNWGAVALAKDGSTNSEVADCDLRHFLAWNVVLNPVEIMAAHLWALAN